MSSLLGRQHTKQAVMIIMAIESTIEQIKAGPYHNINCSTIPATNLSVGLSPFQFLIQHQAPADPYAILLLVLLVLLFGIYVS